MDDIAALFRKIKLHIFDGESNISASEATNEFAFLSDILTCLCIIHRGQSHI
jgi:hypothetical protein